MPRTAKLLRICAFLCVLSGTFTFAPLPSSPAKAASPDIVISQVYGGGGNSGATYKNDYIELFNRGSVEVSLDGWSVQYASATGTNWKKTDLSGTLQPGQYFLIQQAAGSGGTADLPRPDAIGTIGMDATAGKVALVNNQNLLTDACPGGLVDLLGYGTAVVCPGITPTANLSATKAAKRNTNGCTDTGDNSADFTLANPTFPPTPRNTSTVLPCGPTVTINKADAQPDPTTVLPILFEVAFSRPVTGFSEEDVTVSGTAPGPKTVSVTGGGAVYTVAISGATGTGTVSAAIPAGAAQDANGYENIASTSTDHVVAYGSPPTGISLTPASVPENQPVGSLVGLLAASDPDPGDIHIFSLTSDPAACPSAPDNASFQVPPGGTELRTAAVFDYETKPAYTLCLRVVDFADLSYYQQFTISILDVNEPPSISLANTVTALDEDTDTSLPFKVADIIVTDDALGVNQLSLSDADKDMFVIVGAALFLRGGAALNFQTNPVLDVTVNVDDPIVGASPDDSASLSISILPVDHTLPSVTLEQAAAQADPTNAAPILFTVTFSEAVIGFTSADVTVTGSAPGPKTVAVTGSGAAYTVAVGGMTGSGTVSASIPAGAAQDASGNLSLASTSADNTVVYDVDFPCVVSITRLDLTPTAAPGVGFTVTFSEPVTGVDASDFALTSSGLIGISVTGVSGGGTTYTVMVGTGSGAGTLRLDVSDNDSILDTAHNRLGGPGAGNGSFTAGQEYRVRTASFGDVAYTHWAWQWIERLYAARITGGCGETPLVYCPEEPVTRAQMAIFLLRGMYGSSYLPPAATGATFGDVPSTHWAAGWIEKLFADGITSGCGNNNYCPEYPVTRAQMALFLLRAKHGAAYAPPAATGLFSDVPATHWAADWIERLYAEGITTGCGVSPLTYCPEDPVTRAQMAVFLVRTFNLP